MGAGHRGYVRRSGFTIAYQDPCSLSGSHWIIWFGGPHPLPIPTIILASAARRHGAFGLVWVVITIPYHASDLGLGLPRVAFTNLYHRGEGLTIDQDL